MLTTKRGPRLPLPARLAVIVVESVFVLTSVMPPVHAATQNAYLWRNDDGSETTATSIAPENTPITDVAKNVAMRLRFGAANGGAERELRRNAALALGQSETAPTSAVIDTATGFAYFGTNSSPAKIVKVRLSDLTEVASMTLGSGENNLTSAVIDTSGVTHYAYFGTKTVPGKVIKINLTTFTESAALTLGSGENDLVSAIIDTNDGFAYFGTSTAPGKIAKIDLTIFAEAVGSPLVLGTNENDLRSAVIDTSGATHYAYFGAYVALPHGQIAKIDLTTFTEAVGSPLVLGSSGEDYPASAVIDTSAGFAYFGTFTFPGKVVKIDLSTFTEAVGSPLATSAEDLSSAVIDTANGFAYFGVQDSSPAKILKIDLATFTENVSSPLTLGSGNVYLEPGVAVIDPTAGLALFATQADPGKIVKVTLSSFTEAAGSPLTLGSGEDSPEAQVIDTAAGFAYLGMQTNPAKIVKIDLATFTEVASITLPSGESNLTNAIIDTAAGFAYFTTYSGSAKVIKIDLSTFTEAAGSPLALASLGTSAASAVIDTSGATHYAYFGSAVGLSPGRVAKVDLSTFTEAAGSPLTLGSGESNLSTAVIDPSAGFAYFATYAAPSKIVKIDLATFTENVSSPLVLGSGEDYPLSAVIDTAAGFAYFTTYDAPSKVVKIDLATFTENASSPLALGSGENAVQSSVIDVAAGFAYFGIDNSDVTKKVVKVDLATFTEAAGSPLALASGETSLRRGLIDPAAGFAYFSTNTFPAKVIKIDIGPVIHPSFKLEYGVKVTSCSAITSWTAVPTGSSVAWKSPQSSNVNDGDPTTNNAGLTDGNSVFVAGEVKEDSSSAIDAIALGFTNFTEVEFAVEATANAVSNAHYCFRLTDVGNASSFTYDTYAEATLAASASHGGGPSTPTISLFQPNGGEVLTASQTSQIFWSSGGSGIQAIRLSLSIDGGNTYATIVPNIGDVGFSAWTVPEIPTTHARIRAEALGTGDAVLAWDASNADFTILTALPPVSGSTPPPPDLTSTSPSYSPVAALAATSSIDQDKGLVAPSLPTACAGAKLIKLRDDGDLATQTDSTVYYCGADGKRYDFPNPATYFSWYDDFSGVSIVSAATMAAIPLGGNVTYRPGKRMVKVQTDPKVYEVSRDGTLRWVTTAEIAQAAHGAGWARVIDDVPDAFFGDYTTGDSITKAL
jgi:hypothetical protein